MGTGGRGRVAAEAPPTAGAANAVKRGLFPIGCSDLWRRGFAKAPPARDHIFLRVGGACARSPRPLRGGTPEQRNDQARAARLRLRISHARGATSGCACPFIKGPAGNRDPAPEVQRRGFPSPPGALRKPDPHKMAAAARWSHVWVGAETGALKGGGGLFPFFCGGGGCSCLPPPY